MNIIKWWKQNLAIRSSDDDNYVDLSGANSMFGSMGGRRIPIPTTKDFIPDGFNGETINLNDRSGSPRWIGLDSPQMQAWAYDFCSPLAAVIDRLAQADSNGRIEFLDDKGATRKNINKIPELYRVKKLLLNPNPLQTWPEFNMEQVVLAKKHGYCPVFAIGPAGLDKTYTKFFVNLDPVHCTPSWNENFNLYDKDIKNHNPIKEWYVHILGKEYTIPASDILLIKDGLGVDSHYHNLGLPKSKIEGLDYFVSNICAAMEADNVLLKKKGPLGVFSHDPKPDIAGWLPMENVDKEDMQEQLKRYGLTWGQLQYVISKTPIKWNAMSFNLRDLMTKETIRMGIDVICDRLDYPAELMSGKNATYENRSSAEKFLYQNNIIPFSLRRMARYCSFFGIEGLVLDYDHLPVLQEDTMKAGQAREARSNSLLVDWTAGMISYNEYRRLQELDTMPNMENVFYPDYIKLHPEMKPAAPVKTEKTKDATSSKGSGAEK